MSDESTESNEDEMAPDKAGWENRVLCSDESCIGVIGPDGRCKECGKSYDGAATEEGSPAEESNETQTDADGSDDFDDAEPSQTDTADSDCKIAPYAAMKAASGLSVRMDVARSAANLIKAENPLFPHPGHGLRSTIASLR